MTAVAASDAEVIKTRETIEDVFGHHRIPERLHLRTESPAASARWLAFGTKRTDNGRS